jgi:hypothetical protein
MFALIATGSIYEAKIDLDELLDVNLMPKYFSSLGYHSSSMLL